MSKNQKTTVEIGDPLEMVGFLKGNGTACRFVSIVSRTLVKNLRAGCPWRGQVTKVSRKVGMINMNFNTAVRKRIAEKLGVEINDVEYQNGNVWYQHLHTVDGKPLPVVVNKKTPDNGEHYLQFFPTKAESSYVLADGTPIEEEKLKPFFYADNREEWKPVVISINVANIKKLCASGVVMQAEDLAEAEAELANVAAD
jgi:hypothetical protein